MRSPAPATAAARLADAARLFSGRRLTLARQVAGLRKNGLAERIGKTPTAVAGYENGTKRPAPATVAQLALTLKVEPSFFMAADAPDTPIPTPHFRSLRSTTQLVRDQAHAYGCLVADVAASLEKYVELPQRDVPRRPVPPDEVATGEAEAAAADVRAGWGMGTGPAGHLVRLLENKGVLVVFSLPQTAAVDAFSIEAGDRPIILLNPVKEDYYRQRFDLAHELGHLVMHTDAEPGSKLVEDQAHRFASEFLMPAAGIIDELPARVDWQRLFALKERWGVSLQALLMRCRQLKVMSESTYQKAMVTLSSRGWRRQEPGEGTAPELPSLLPRSVDLLEAAGYPARTLAEQARVPVFLFEMATSRRPTTAFGLPEGDASDKREHEDVAGGVATLPIPNLYGIDGRI
ncbi:helix-turn-helix domain-containing protein [Micromonospora sp. CB01531]|uniref:helix-turn-helix domain-containing protein n=1 Tax=Micromonospora sp. CB01531 TaxID=1718947 RepID=UPI00093A0D99|nr:XRE family transcriptional regulator [Micromonospora sp. CB01531]OKI85930.1 Xre family DNA binding protein [Micromonospora sp. CB01531]